MAWEYLEDKDYRYEMVSGYVQPGDVVVDLNSGNSRFIGYGAVLYDKVYGEDYKDNRVLVVLRNGK